MENSTSETKRREEHEEHEKKVRKRERIQITEKDYQT
jgi:hypothetical protein